MTVVADTSPLNYLVLIGGIDVLPSLYRQIAIPPAVRHGIEVVGTLGVLPAGAERNLVDFEGSIGDLERTSFYMSQRLKAALLREWRGRNL